MNRATVAKVVLGALAALACAEAAQAGLIFRRGNRRVDDCCCYGGNGYAYSGGMYGHHQYAYAPMYAGAYACGCGPTGYTTGYPMVSGAYSSAYADPNGFTIAAGPLAADKARVRIRVPSADARLWLDNQMVQTGGAERVFDLPLTAGQALKHTVTAQWTKDGRDLVRKKEFDVRAGQEVEVTIRASDAETSTNSEQLPVTPNPADSTKPKADKP